jgi:hypothetical protein
MFRIFGAPSLGDRAAEKTTMCRWSRIRRVGGRQDGQIHLVSEAAFVEFADQTET